MDLLQEIVAYFATKNMGSVFLTTIDVVWENLDEIEKQMVRSFKEAKAGNCLIYSKLQQPELNEQVASTPYVTL